MSTLPLVLLCLMMFFTLFILLWRVKGEIVLKMWTLTAVAITTIALFQTFEFYKGYPVVGLPETGRILSIYKVDKTYYIWVANFNKPDNGWLNFFTYNYNSKEPRAYIFYTPNDDTEKEWDDLVKKSKNGYYIGLKGSKKSKDKNKPGDDGGPIVPAFEIKSPEEMMPKDNNQH